jgi:cytochrome P450
MVQMVNHGVPMAVKAVYCAIGFAALKMAYKYLQFWSTPLRKLPGPKRKSFVLGHFLDIVKSSFMGPQSKWIAQIKEATGSVPPMISYSTLFGSWSVLVLNCEIVKDILTAQASKRPLRFEKNYDRLRQIGGNGLVVLEGEDWSRHRRIIQPCFQQNALTKPISTAAQSFTERLIRAWSKASGRTIDASSHMQALTLDILGQASLSHNFHAIEEVEKWAESRNEGLADITDSMVQSLKASFKLSSLGVLLRTFDLTSIYHLLDRKANQSCQLLRKAANNILQNARTADFSTDVDRRSLIQQLFHSQSDRPSNTGQELKAPLTEEELRNEITTFIVAGHETTSTWCHWALFALGRHPTIQQKIVEEIHTYAPDRDTFISLDDITKMSYFQAFLTETLRAYSPVGMIARYTTTEETWEGFTIPSRTRLVIPIHLIHHHPDYWERPEVFDPERWLNAQETATRHKFAFLPFSFGPRNCVGYRFAEMEAKLIIANIVRELQVELIGPPADKEISFTNFIAMKCQPPVEIKVFRRAVHGK